MKKFKIPFLFYRDLATIINIVSPNEKIYSLSISGFSTLRVNKVKKHLICNSEKRLFKNSYYPKMNITVKPL